MTNNTETYWTANGLSLHTHAWSVRSFGGRKFFTGSKRGEDVRVPFKPGRIWVPKSRESQLYNIKMWVLPLNQDGSKDGSMTFAQKSTANRKLIIETVDIDGQFDLVKRWWDGTNIVSATAQAEFVDGSGPDRDDDGGGFYFDLQFLLADPYFYVGGASQAIDGSVTIDGDAPTNHVTVTFTAGTNPRVTFADGNWIQYNGVVGGTPVIINCLAGTAKISSNYVNGLITRNPDFPEWARLDPGVQVMSMSGSGGPAGTLEYDAAYR